MDTRGESTNRTVPRGPATTGDFADFFARHHDRLFGALCIITRSPDEADEIAQDAFLKVWERWERVQRMESSTGYLFATAMNLFRRRYRRAILAKRVGLRPSHREDALAEVESRDAVVRALKTLSPNHRAALLLTALFDYDSTEAGRILHMKPATVRTLAARARAALRQSVEETDG